MRSLSPGQRRRSSVRLRGTVFLAFVLLVLAIGLVKLSRPLDTLRSQEERLTSLRLKKSALLDERRRLEDYKRYLATETGQEAAARRQGYLRRGERRVVFVRAESPDCAAPSDEPEASRNP